MQYAEGDRDTVVAWNALAHDADNNRYRQTSIETKVKVVQNAKARVLGQQVIGENASLEYLLDQVLLRMASKQNPHYCGY